MVHFKEVLEGGVHKWGCVSPECLHSEALLHTLSNPGTSRAQESGCRRAPVTFSSALSAGLLSTLPFENQMKGPNFPSSAKAVS